jgi:hypothetical protein
MGLTVSIETPEAVRIPHADTAKVALIYPVLESMSFLILVDAGLPPILVSSHSISLQFTPVRRSVRSDGLNHFYKFCLPPFHFVFLLHFNTNTIALTTLNTTHQSTYTHTLPQRLIIPATRIPLSSQSLICSTPNHQHVIPTTISPSRIPHGQHAALRRRRTGPRQQ